MSDPLDPETVGPWLRYGIACSPSGGWHVIDGRSPAGGAVGGVHFGVDDQAAQRSADRLNAGGSVGGEVVIRMLDDAAGEMQALFDAQSVTTASRGGLERLAARQVSFGAAPPNEVRLPPLDGRPVFAPEVQHFATEAEVLAAAEEQVERHGLDGVLRPPVGPAVTYTMTHDVVVVDRPGGSFDGTPGSARRIAVAETQRVYSRRELAPAPIEPEPATGASDVE